MTKKYGFTWRNKEDGNTYKIMAPKNGHTKANCENCDLRGKAGCIQSPCTDPTPWGCMVKVGVGKS